MSIRVAINHKTSYFYDRSINVSPQLIRLKPAPHTRTKIIDYSLEIKPTNHFINWLQDPFGNHIARVVFPEKINEFIVDVEVVADLVVINPFDFFVEEYAKVFPFQYDSQLLKELTPYLEIKEKGMLLNQWLDKFKSSQQINTIDYLVKLNTELQQYIQYTIRMEPGIQDCEETLSKKIADRQLYE